MNEVNSGPKEGPRKKSAHRLEPSRPSSVYRWLSGTRRLPPRAETKFVDWQAKERPNSRQQRQGAMVSLSFAWRMAAPAGGPPFSEVGICVFDASRGHRRLATLRAARANFHERLLKSLNAEMPNSASCVITRSAMPISFHPFSNLQILDLRLVATLPMARPWEETIRAVPTDRWSAHS